MFDIIKRWFKGPVDDKPSVSLELVDGKLKVVKYNDAFVVKLRAENGDLTDGMNDAEVIRLFEDRENVEREPPRLEVVHEGINEDGTIAMKLDWNKSFISLLREHGIVGSTDEEAVTIYMNRISRSSMDADNDDGLNPATQLQNFHDEVDRVTQTEVGEILVNLQQAIARGKRE